MSEVHRHPKIKQTKDLVKTPFKGKHTLSACFKEASKRNGNKKCMGWRTVKRYHNEADPDAPGRMLQTTEYEPGMKWLTYSETSKRIRKFGSGLVQFGNLNPQDTIGVYLDTKPEWMISAQGAFQHSIVVATCYANLGIEALTHVINETNLTVMVVDSYNLPMLIKISKDCPTLRKVIVVGDMKDSGHTPFDVKSFDAVVMMGSKKPTRPVAPPTGDSLAVIMYTSGSTGMPKGVMVAHKQLVASATGMMKAITPQPNDAYLGYLPLAHILELAAEHAVLFTGASIGYGNPRTLTVKPGGAKLKGDIELIRPTVMAGVPRVWDTIKKGALLKVNSGSAIKKWLFNKGYASSSSSLKSSGSTSFLWNTLVFSKLQAALGGRMRVIVSGGAPLGEETHEFLRVAFNCSVIQGYGLTETCGGGTIQSLNKYRTRCVGYPIQCAEIKLVDVPDMNYVTTNDPPQGEVWIKGNNVTNGYYKNPKKTAEEFDSDGWFHTGDIGQWNEDGTLSIIDRKKNLVKLSHGEYVALEALEMIYGNSPFIQPNGICVYGDSYRNHVVAIVLLHPQYAKKWASSQNLKMSLNELVKHPKLKKAVMDSLNLEAQKKKKKRFEYIADCFITTDEWTPENGMLTAAMKLKRQAINANYMPQIEDMYKGGANHVRSKL